MGDCVNRRDVHVFVGGLYISCSYNSYRNVTADDNDVDVDGCCSLYSNIDLSSLSFDGFGIDTFFKLLSSPISSNEILLVLLLMLLFELTIEEEGSCDGGDDDEEEGIITALKFSRGGVFVGVEAT
jgi:hypothetical protein